MIVKKVCNILKIVAIAILLMVPTTAEAKGKTEAKRKSESATLTTLKKKNWWEENQTYSTRFRAEQLVAPVALVGIGALGIGENAPMRGINLAIKILKFVEKVHFLFLRLIT